MSFCDTQFSARIVLQASRNFDLSHKFTSLRNQNNPHYIFYFV